MVDQNEMDKITTAMMEHLCDHLCRFPRETERKEDLEDICAGCEMGKHVCNILNTGMDPGNGEIARARYGCPGCGI
jgi:hypothetical protein